MEFSIKSYPLRLALLIGLMAASLTPQPCPASTLMSFTQRDSSEYLRFNDTGSSTSSLTTFVGSVLGASMDVDFTFSAANSLYSIGTTVQAKFNFSAPAFGPYGSFGFTKLQGIDNVSFSFTNAAGTVNYLSGTSDAAYLVQMAGNTAAIDFSFDTTALRLSSDAFNIDTLNDSTQAVRLDFSPMTPAFFGDSNTNTYLDTVNMNVQGNALGVPGAVPEPGSAVLLLVGLALGVWHRRR